ncbi:hypothetical protein [Clostridium sp. UBA2485]|nr:hypothetical protein [Clostridium sp. UBA2485]
MNNIEILKRQEELLKEVDFLAERRTEKEETLNNEFFLSLSSIQESLM